MAEARGHGIRQEKVTVRRLAIFDLDGTLIDSKLDIAHGVNASRAELGLGPLSLELIGTYVGNGAPVLIRRALGPSASEAEVERGLAFFLAWYAEHKLDNTCLYPGVRAALDRLRHAEVRLAVLTNKPVRISQAILEGLGVGGHFFRIYGGNSFPEKKPSPVGVDALIAESGVERFEAVIVGDSSVDVRTARNAGVSVYGVTYGFAPESFEQDPPDEQFDSMAEVADCILDS